MNQLLVEIQAILMLLSPLWIIGATIILVIKSNRTEEKIDYILQWIDKNNAKEEIEEIERQLEELKR